MVRICKEESFHQRQGYEIMMTLCARHAGAEGDGAGCAEPLVVAVADDVRPPRQGVANIRDTSMRWKIKRYINDELRQKFVDATVPQGHFLGLTFPDPDLKLDEASGPLALRRDRLGRVPPGRRRQRALNRDRMRDAPQGA